MVVDTPARLDAEVRHDLFLVDWLDPIRSLDRPPGLMRLSDIVKQFPAAKLALLSWALGKRGMPLIRALGDLVGGESVREHMQELRVVAEAAEAKPVLLEIEHLEGRADRMTWMEYARHCDALKRALVGELADDLYLRVDTDKAKRAFGERFGRQVLEQFPGDDMAGEIRAAFVCWAFDLPTSAVFHLMRIVEVGLRTLVKVAHARVLVRRPTWHHYLTAIESKLPDPKKQKGPRGGKKKRLSRRDEGFLSDAAIHIRDISRAWRGDVVHEVAAYYEEERATAILNSIQAFMQGLARYLAERKKP